METDCIFCRIATGQLEADVVYEGERVIAFRDVNPQAPTHVQVIPREHVAKISGFEASRDAGWLVELIEAARRVAEQEGLDKGFRLVVNDGPLAGQSVQHVHLHVLGGRQLAWPPG